MELRISAGFILALVFIITTIFSVTEGLKCYQCGTFLATTSVSPCTNLTREHLKECQHAFCIKYVGVTLSSVVYGCEPNCQEKRFGEFESYCCSEDRCNGSPRMPQSWTVLQLLLSVLPLILFWSGVHLTQ